MTEKFVTYPIDGKFPGMGLIMSSGPTVIT